MKNVYVSFAAVQLKDEETNLQGIERFMRVADQIGSGFRYLEIYGQFTIGPQRFVRFKTDCYRIKDVAEELVAEGRGVVFLAPGSSQYDVRLASGRRGTLPMTVLQASPIMAQQQTLRGPKLPHWERQFLPTPKPMHRGQAALV